MHKEQGVIILAMQEDWFRTYLRNGLNRAGYRTYPFANGQEAMNLLSLLCWTSEPVRLLILDSSCWNEMADTFCSWRNRTETELPALVVDLPDVARKLRTAQPPNDCLYSIDLRKLITITDTLLQASDNPGLKQ